MVIGTPYFKSHAHAIRYYQAYHNGNYAVASDEVEGRLLDGSIRLGIPPHRPGDRVFLIDNMGRYAIEEGG